MAVGGFPIKASEDRSVTSGIPYLGSIQGAFDSVNNVGGFAQFVDNGSGDLQGLVIGQTLFLNSAGAGDYEEVYGIITAIDPDNDTITTTIPFNGSDTGSWWQGENCLFDSDTPEGFLREIHVQFDYTAQDNVMQITFDGVNYMPINNGDTLNGLSTVTLFVTKNTKFNMMSKNAGIYDSTIIVTAS